MSEINRYCLSRFYLDSASYRQIGYELGKSLGAVASQMKRAKEEFKKKVIDEGFVEAA